MGDELVEAGVERVDFTTESLEALVAYELGDFRLFGGGGLVVRSSLENEVQLGPEFSDDFLKRYRAAQGLRVERLDRITRERIRLRNVARAAARKTGSAADRRAATATDFMLIYRTDADPRYVDPSIDPSDRDYGSLWGRRPDIINYGAVGFSRMVSPEAWLSTWSGNASQAEIARTGKRMTLPALVVEYRGDNAIFPSDTQHIVDSLGSKEIVRKSVPGDHYGFPAETGRDAAVEEVIAWLRKTG